MKTRFQLNSAPTHNAAACAGDAGLQGDTRMVLKKKRPTARTTSVTKILDLAKRLPADEREGLMDALAAEFELTGRLFIATDRIDRNNHNPRSDFDEAKLDNLAASMASEEQRTPIQVIRHPREPGRFMLIDGERRWRAARKRKITRLRVVVEQLNERDAENAMILSHGFHDPLNPIDEAVCIDRIDELGRYFFTAAVALILQLVFWTFALASNIS